MSRKTEAMPTVPPCDAESPATVSRAEWLASNKSAIAGYNRHIRLVGVFSVRVRTF
jgi:post-segregation antitoxin (ccd killing protein)